MTFKQFFESKSIFLPPSVVSKLETAIGSLGGKIWVVGGAVRDALMPDTPPSKDVDLVVTNLPISDPDKAVEAIIRALKPVSKRVSLEGDSFGVIKAVIDGEDLDIALPRKKETKTGEAHADFEVELDPTNSIESDLTRRDLTVNAMAASLDGSTVIDPTGGRSDIKAGLLRAVGDPTARFAEDPLRMLRVLQFSARFGFEIEPETMKGIRANVDRISTEPGERIIVELTKALTKGKADQKTLIKGLEDSGLGKEILGPEFRPIPVESDNPIVKFIALFIRGGDLERIKAPNALTDHLDMTRNFMSDKPPYTFVTKHTKKMVPNVFEFFRAIGDEKLESKAEKALKVAIVPTDLAIGGREMMELGIKGVKIGELQKEMLEQIWVGNLENTVESLGQFLQERMNEI